MLQGCYKIKQMPVQPKKIPKLFWHSKSNMLPSSIRDLSIIISNPVFSGFSSTGSAKSTLTGKADLTNGNEHFFLNLFSHSNFGFLWFEVV